MIVDIGDDSGRRKVGCEDVIRHTPFVDLTTFTTLEVVALAEVWRDVKRRGVAANRDIFGRSPAGDANILPEERTLSLEKDKEREEYPRGRVAINGSRKGEDIVLRLGVQERERRKVEERQRRRTHTRKSDMDTGGGNRIHVSASLHFFYTRRSNKVVREWNDRDLNELLCARARTRARFDEVDGR